MKAEPLKGKIEWLKKTLDTMRVIGALKGEHELRIQEQELIDEAFEDIVK